MAWDDLVFNLIPQHWLQDIWQHDSVLLRLEVKNRDDISSWPIALESGGIPGMILSTMRFINTIPSAMLWDRFLAQEMLLAGTRFVESQVWEGTGPQLYESVALDPSSLSGTLNKMSNMDVALAQKIEAAESEYLRLRVEAMARVFFQRRLSMFSRCSCASSALKYRNPPGWPQMRCWRYRRPWKRSQIIRVNDSQRFGLS
jgi:hypothetical protein